MASSMCCIYLVLLTAVSAAPSEHPSPPPLNTTRWHHETGSEVFRKQMENPSEVFSVLLLIGGDIVQKAVAQMCGRRVTFVAFSFGWVAYAFSTLMSAFGDGSLLPDPEIDIEVITIPSGNKRSNRNWVLSRLLRDLEYDVDKRLETWHESADGLGDNEKDLLRTEHGLLPTTDGHRQCFTSGKRDSGLLVTFCKANPGWASPTPDAGLYAYFVVAIVQFVIAAVPVILYGDWSVLFMTTVGTALALSTAALREWRLEKYGARLQSSGEYALTRGNGYPHIFIIQSPGLYLDDLASAVRKADLGTRILSGVLALLWVFFLIIAGGIREHTWFLLVVGLVGMAQNVWVAGRHRSSSAHGLPVELGRTFGCKTRGNPIMGLKVQGGGQQVYEASRRRKVMRILQELELHAAGVGQALMPEFFPTSMLRDNERDWWRKVEESRDSKGIKPMPVLPFAPEEPNP